MSLALQEISCQQVGSTFRYDLDTSLFNESVFKMCTECGIFTDDFADMFCDECKAKLDYLKLNAFESMMLVVESHRCEDGSEDCLDCGTKEWEDSGSDVDYKLYGGVDSENEDVEVDSD